MNIILPLLEATKKASLIIRRLSSEQKKQILLRLAVILEMSVELIITENKKDLDLMPDNDPKKDRLLLNAKRIIDLANSLRDVAELPDPSGQVIQQKTLDNGIKLTKMAVPLGVVGVIYESRPNVTIDVVALCIRSGNACVLKGGKEAHHSNTCLIALIHQALELSGIDKNAVLLLPTDRKFVQELLTATRYVDIIIPRGSDALIQFVRQNSLIPTIETGAGVCHTYVEKTANLVQARDIVVNARVSRPSVCNSLDCLLLDEIIAETFLPMLLQDFIKYNVEIFADDVCYPVFETMNYPYLQHAQEEHYGKEYLDYKITVMAVKDSTEALEHIEKYSSRHSEAILSEDAAIIEQFLQEVDAAAVYANASTRFTDGGVFGLGAEIGISTQKLHARGPFALEKLVTEKWIAIGNGQIRN